MSALDQWGQTWNSCEAKTSDFITPADGKYDVEVEDVKYDEIDDRQGGVYPQFTWIFRILNGENEDCRFRKYTVLRKPGNFEFLKGEMMTIGLPVSCSVWMLPNILRMAIGAIIEVQVKSSVRTKQNGEPYKECYVKKILKKSQWMISGNTPTMPQDPVANQAYSGGMNGAGSKYHSNYHEEDSEEIPF